MNLGMNDIKAFNQWLHHHELRYVDMLAWYELKALEFVELGLSFYNKAFTDGYKGSTPKSWPLYDTYGYDYRRWWQAGAFAKHLETEKSKRGQSV